MPVTITYTNPKTLPAIPQSIRQNMLQALAEFMHHAASNPYNAGYENILRASVFNTLCKIPGFNNLFNEGPHVYLGSRYYRPDMLVGTRGTSIVGALTFKKYKIQYLLSDIIEWGHDHAKCIPGCVNKPLADFIKWYILFDPNGQYNYTTLPLCHFQIVTDYSNQYQHYVDRIGLIYSRLNTLFASWKIDYAGHPATVYIFMNYFAPDLRFSTILDPLISPTYSQDLFQNYSQYYAANKGWPMKQSIFQGVNALDALLSI